MGPGKAPWVSRQSGIVGLTPLCVGLGSDAVSVEPVSKKGTPGGRVLVRSVFTDGISEGNGSGKGRGFESRGPGGKGGKSKGGHSLQGELHVPEPGRGVNNSPIRHNYMGPSMATKITQAELRTGRRI